MEIENKSVQFKHPFTCLVSGPSSSGKTILVRRILKHYKLLVYNLNEPILKVLWCYGELNPLLNVPISNNVVLHLHEGIPSSDIIEEFKSNLIVFDDLLNDVTKNNQIENLFVKKSHHLGISVILIVQNFFSKYLRTISLNAQYIILLKNPRDSSQIMTLARQIFPHRPKTLTEAYDDATRSSYGYLKIDLTPETPESYRLQTRITPEEVQHLYKDFSPIIYKPKNV